MSVISFEGDEKRGGIPEEAHVHIESCSGKYSPSTETRSLRATNKDLVYSGYVTGGMVNLNLDPGLYIYKIRHLPEDGVGSTLYGGDFFHECTESQFRKINHMKPLHSSAMIVTDGVRFTCNWIGCSIKTTSRTAALLHESKVHYGRDLLESQNPQAEKQVIDKEFKDSEPEQAKRGPGRPRKLGPQ